ncbi:Gfo/Idh/MocA family protein [Asanoa iriomotensis]|uniref:Oxidoreductase n=1 Tax=Asanoa iriomotensis TaxID=234613 RepID=A0ABQ4BYY0_9ACTN|nr:Gfo/Idh/MocA family oxidoreductase [Asanoa iriomotensis]GIF55724.1 oxidoreductase [Asanoa iriomotensis]
MSAPGLCWGIIGAGFIAGKFVNAVAKRSAASSVVAVGSRDRDKAASWAAEQGVPTAHGSYRELVDDPAVQAVYVATPHVFHLEHALLAVRAGKPVLIEKPIAVSAEQARTLAKAAADAGVFAMEAMWTRFLPHMTALRSLVAAGEIGELVHVHAEHSQHFPYDPAHRLYNPHLAGGALLDLGVYPLALVQDLLGRPTQVAAVGALTETGVDGQASLAMRHGDRAQSTVSTSMWGLSAISAQILGTDGRITFDGPFLRPTTLRLETRAGKQHSFDGEARNGFQFEVDEVARCVADGRTESAVLPLDDSIATLEVIDQARSALGVRYPFE